MQFNGLRKFHAQYKCSTCTVHVGLNRKAGRQICTFLLEAAAHGSVGVNLTNIADAKDLTIHACTCKTLYIVLRIHIPASSPAEEQDFLWSLPLCTRQFLLDESLWRPNIQLPSSSRACLVKNGHHGGYYASPTL